MKGRRPSSRRVVPAVTPADERRAMRTLAALAEAAGARARERVAAGMREETT